MPDPSELFIPSELTVYWRLPRSLSILAENAIRNCYPEDAAHLLARTQAAIRVTPTRLVMQDLLAVSLLADLASLRGHGSDIMECPLMPQSGPTLC